MSSTSDIPLKTQGPVPGYPGGTMAAPLQRRAWLPHAGTVYSNAADAVSLHARVGPWAGVLEASRRLRVARGTVQARLERIAERGVIT